MIRTLLKLAFGGIRARLLASLFTVLLAATATTTIVLALQVGRTVDDARAVAGRSGVAESDDPTPITETEVHLPGGSETILIAGLVGQPRLNIPVGVAGTSRPGSGIVLERSLAEVLGIGIGDVVGLDSARGPVVLDVVGTAIIPSQSRYPRQTPGLAWVSRSTLEAAQPDVTRWSWVQPVRLADPERAAAFAGGVLATFPPQTVAAFTADDQRDSVLTETQPTIVLLTAYTVALLAVVLAEIAILIGARASQQRREIGLAKAVGLTPRQVSLTFAIETVALGVAGLLVGFVVGMLLAPTLAAPTLATLLGAPSIAPNPSDLGVAAVPVLFIMAVGAWTSTRRRSRLTVVDAIRAGVGTPGASSRLARLVQTMGLPLAVVLGLKDTLAQRGRALLLAASIAVTTAAVVFALCMKATLDAQPAGEASDVPDSLPILVYTLDGLLLMIALTTLVAVASLAVRERVRDLGVMRTLGFTPRQVTSGLVGSHLTVAVVAAGVSIPLGIGMYRGVYAMAGGDAADLVLAPWWWLALVPVATAAAVVITTGAPAWLAARAPVVEALRYE
ncbi:MAG TPA: FtsX-like permease family protein [Jiangellaceae bacterium]|nr:FtsX-like permease family protein [Jiangellaceae bacterium]